MFRATSLAPLTGPRLGAVFSGLVRPSTAAAPFLTAAPHHSSRSTQPPAACIPARPHQQTRPSSSNSRWKARQGRDYFAREAKVQGLKSRAAFKLIEMDSRYRLFKKGQLVVDLGYAPGSWSQVAMERTKPGGRVLGIDVIPAQPPPGVATIQGNFLSPVVQGMVKQFVVDVHRLQARDRARAGGAGAAGDDAGGGEADDCVEEKQSYIDMERHSVAEEEVVRAAMSAEDGNDCEDIASPRAADASKGTQDKKLVDIVISDMSEPWPQTTGFSNNTLSNPHRMMNTSGMAFRDHAGSMELCHAALRFASDTLRPGGHFVCKFYQGSADKELETQLRKLFTKVHREKPDSSRSESKEAFFVALRRKAGVALDEAKAVENKEDDIQ
ncbi:hypothetical protein MCOR27_002109 [Pyricularia oryzae]|nr:hypothetical protein MCOR19_000081 [Pyricularia oryzae]KAI6285821.1 hypothetical protein MCOR27_002109 [Pyricularia oryzae]KAI6331549.1 hypothetical protein MCOR30_004751 [Pyricularia oryzae]KAI6409647.1 hypothetical protein MCOR24_007228 [Pyricularia oryzae]KAI6536200.1 hypothetical protein MCOR10_001972 [Pyricularia oryzae]